MSRYAHIVSFALWATLLVSLGCVRGEGSPAPSSSTDEAHEDHEGHGHGEPSDHDEHEGEAESGVVELSEKAAANVNIRVQPVERRSLSGLIATTGTVDFDPDRVAHIGARLSGRLQQTRVELGDRVRAGDILAVIDSVELGRDKSEYLQAKARTELARRTLEREQKLAQERLTSEQSVLNARAALQEQEASLQAAQESLRLSGLTNNEIDRLEYGSPSSALYTIRAPFAGTVVEKHLTRGELVTPEKELLTLVDLSRVWIWIDVYERDIADVHVGDTADIEAPSLRGRALTGTVTFIRPQVDPKTRRIGARVEVANPGAALKAGMFVRVDLRDPHAQDGAADRGSALVVPEGALLRDAGSDVVFVEIEPRHYRRTPVRTGAKADGRVEILEGLDEAARVVVEGAPVLKAEASKAAMGGGHSH